VSRTEEGVVEYETSGEPALERRHGARRDTDRSDALAELSRTLAESIGDTDMVLDVIVRLVSGFLGDTAVVRLLGEDGDTIHLAAAHDPDPAVRELVLSLIGSGPSRLSLLSPYQEAVRLGGPVLVTGERLDASYARLPADKQAQIRALRLHTTLVCPLRVRGSVIGTLALWRRGARGVHSERDQSFCQELADRAALAIENARLVAQLRAELAARVRAEESTRLTAELLQRADEKRRVLVENLVTAQEEERRRIALDVHDDSIQAMAAVGLRLQVLRRRAQDPETVEKITAIEEAVLESVNRLRGLLFLLDSASLEKVGLARAISQYLNQLFPDGEPRSQVRSTLSREPTGHIRVVMYRIAQEALSNVRKHAQATEVVIALSDIDNGYLVSIQDDGVGFDPDEVAARNVPGHMGLRNMRERAEIAGGWFQLDCRPDGGTTVRYWVPALERAG
jgi:signal transduction histidine kinase